MDKLRWTAGAAAVLGGVAWAGLKVPPGPFAPPVGDGDDLGMVALPDDLPDPVQRYYRALALFPRVQSVYVSGRGRLLVAGRVWAPVRWRLYLEPGRQFCWDIELAWMGQPVLGGEAKITGGTAELTTAGQTFTGQAIHKAEHTVLWIYTLAFCPTALFTLPSVSWEPVESSVARLHFPQFDSAAPPFTLFFDPASSALERVHTERFDNRFGFYRPYKVTFGPRRSMAGTSLTNQIGAAWGGDFYVHMNVEEVRYNIPLPFLSEPPAG